MARPARYSGLLRVSQLRRELDELFQEVVAATETLAPATAWNPGIDVLDLPGSVRVLVEVPGLTAEQLEVEVEAGILCIRGRRQLRAEIGGERRYHCLERQEGSFSRQLEVPCPVNYAASRAHLESGVLTIELPKLEDRRRQRRAIAITEDEEGP
jgi:HSP20 family protein